MEEKQINPCCLKLHFANLERQCYPVKPLILPFIEFRARILK